MQSYSGRGLAEGGVAGIGEVVAGEAGVEEEPFFYAVAGRLQRVMGLSREEQLELWRQVVEAYRRLGRPLPQALRDLCEPPFVEALLEDEIFWGLAGVEMGRACYAEATGHLPAIYATAALLASCRDRLEVSTEVERWWGETAGVG